MDIPNIHNCKYTPSPLPEICAPRRELLFKLKKTVHSTAAFICAPAGSGKTVSVQLWIKDMGRKLAWIDLDSYDNGTAVFYKLFCAGILSIQPYNKRMTAIIQAENFASDPVEHTLSLLAEFIMDGNEHALVLDDFHTITNNEILKSLPFILRRMPNSFATFILSRKEPDENFTDFIEQGQIQVVAAEALFFSKTEIKEYFTLLGRDVSEKEAQSAYDLTGGWAISVNVLGQSASPIREVGIRNRDYKIIADNENKYILERYITKHIWSGWSEGLCSFMVTCAALDEIPVALCEKITSKTDAVELLEHLRAGNAFVVRISDDTYRYHHLFLDYLRKRPEYANTDKSKVWRLAAEHYLKQGNYLAARRYSCISGDIRTILDVLYESMQVRGRPMENFVEVMYKLYFASETAGYTETLCERCPALYLSTAYVAFLAGDDIAFEKHADKLRANLVKIALQYPRFAEMALSVSVLDYRISFAKQIAQSVSFPITMFNDEKINATFMSLQMPFAHRSFRDFHELTDRKLHIKLKQIYCKILKNHCDLIMHDMSAGLLLEQNRTAEALTEAQAAMSKMTDKTIKEVRFATYLHHAAIYFVLGKENELAQYIKKTENFVDTQAGAMRYNFLAFTARIKLWNGDVAAARKWLSHYFVTEAWQAANARPLEPYKIYQYFTTVRAYVVSGEIENAEELALRLRKLGQNFNRLQDAAEAGVIIAAILWAKNKKNEAQEMMETVLLEMQPHRFIRLIADEGASVLQVLKKISNKCGQPDYKGGISSAYVNSVYIATYAVSRQRKGITSGLVIKPIKLSKQQKVIIELLGQGYKIDMIVEKTGLTLNTIKTYRKAAYEKLGANNAAEAVLRARELGIIE